MKRTLSWFALGLLAAAIGGNSIGCSSDDSGGGGSGAASGSGGSLVDASGGTSGTGFGAMGGTGGTGATGATGGAGGAPSMKRLGRACASDAECGDGLECVTADSGKLGGSGPAKGMCTVSCDGSDADICGPFDANAVCLNFGDMANPASYCVEGCEFGPSGLNMPDPDKCHGRAEVACAPLQESATSPVIPACLPQCNADPDCGTGLFCNPDTGRCGTEQRAGKGTGEPCTPTGDAGGDPNECRGGCLNFQVGSGTANICGEGCTSGVIPSCGWNGPGTGVADAFCLYTFTVIIDAGGPGYGDAGSCAALCDCSTPCTSPALVCSPIGNASFVMSVGRPGICTDPTDSEGGVTEVLDCADGAGGAGGAAGAAGAGGSAAGTAGAGGSAAGTAGAAGSAAGTAGAGGATAGAGGT